MMPYEPDGSDSVSVLSSIEAEEAVMAAILIDPACLAGVSGILSADDFFFFRNRAVYAACLRLMADGTPIDLLTVKDALAKMVAGAVGDTDSYLLYLLSEHVSSLHVEAYAHIVKRYAVRRAVLKMLQANVEVVLDGDADTSAVLASVQQGLNAAFHEIRISSVRHQREVVSDYYDRVMAIQAGNATPRLKTGIVDLDKKLGGGIGTTWFVVVSAPSGGGKTTFKLQIALNAASAGNKVMVFSREMGEDELVARIITQKSGLSAGEQQSVMDDRQLQRFVNASGNIEGLPIFYDCTSSTMTKIRASALQTHQAQGLSLVIIDYIQIVDPSDCNGYNREQEVAYISRMCKLLAADLGIPVFAGSQQNDDGKVRESRAIRNDADLLLVIDSSEADAAEQGTKLVTFDKFRHGPDKSNVEGGGVRLYYDPNRLYFGDLVR